jgi:5-methylcytosine-specific restriction endonuclease McrA
MKRLEISISKLRLQKPKNLTKLSVDQMRGLYPPHTRRAYAKPIDVLRYWENDFHLDWGEPECFGCQNLTFAGIDGVEPEVWNQYFERCHIVAATYGGPAEAWNIVYLCNWCHRIMDHLFEGKPDQYDNIVNWIKNRRQNVSEHMVKELRLFATEDLALDDMLLVAKFFQSNQAMEYYKNHRIDHHFNPADEVILRWKYAFGILSKLRKHPQFIECPTKERENRTDEWLSLLGDEGF